MTAFVIGLIYGIVWNVTNMFATRFIASKSKNTFIVGLVPIMISIPIMLSIILFKPFISNWHAFIQIWFLSFLTGALVFKFTIAKRFSR